MLRSSVYKTGVLSHFLFFASFFPLSSFLYLLFFNSLTFRFFLPSSFVSLLSFFRYFYWRWNNVVGINTSLRAGRSGIQIPAEAKQFSLL